MVMGQVGEGRTCAGGQGLGAPVGGMSEGALLGGSGLGEPRGWGGKDRPGWGSPAA